MTFLSAVQLQFLIASTAMFFLWFVERLKREADIVDVAWAFLIGLSALIFALISPGSETNRIITGCLGGAWGLRLSLYLYKTRFLSPEEDGRYEELRKSWSGKSFFIFFQAQALFVVAFALPFVAISFSNKPFDNFTISGIVLFFISIIGASISDSQLHNFRKNLNNKGKVCNTGLWKYSRHPNYFFEWLHWIAYPLITFGSEYFVYTLHAAPFMLFLILKITGIPPTEARSIASRGEAYKIYQKSTSAFFPWFPQKI